MGHAVAAAGIQLRAFAGGTVILLTLIAYRSIWMLIESMKWLYGPVAVLLFVGIALGWGLRVYEQLEHGAPILPSIYKILRLCFLAAAVAHFFGPSVAGSHAPKRMDLIKLAGGVGALLLSVLPSDLLPRGVGGSRSARGLRCRETFALACTTILAEKPDWAYFFPATLLWGCGPWRA